MKAMLLAAGLGERMRPLTYGRAKPSLPLLNRPLILTTLGYLKQHGVDEVVINLHHQPESIRGVVGDGSRIGLKVHYSEEQIILGTAGGLKKAESFFRGGSTLILINSDFVTDCDLSAAVETHRKSAARATLILTPHRPGTDYGSVEIDGDGRVISIAGRPPLRKSTGAATSTPPTGPGQTKSGYTFIGIHILEPSLLDQIPPGVKFEINRDLYPPMIGGGGRVQGHVFEGFWRELGTPRLYLDGSMTILGEDRDPTLKSLRQGEGLYLEQVHLPQSTTAAPPILIGRGTSVGKGCSLLGGVVIGRQCRIGAECALRSTILWDGARLGDRSHLTECILTSGVYVPPGTSLSGRILFRVEGYQGKKDGLERVGNCWAARLQ
jgi:NDP-sugar pyrophosphorylase family protein